MTETLRFNSTDALSGEPRRATENGEEYLVVPAAVSREQVLAYNDDASAYDHEFLPGEELASGVDRVNSVPITLNHPLVATPSGGIQSALTTTPGAQYTEVGEFRALRMNSEGKKALGEVWLPVDERDEHTDDYREAFDTLDDGGEVGTSLGYAVGEVDPTPERHNGQQYDAVQRSLDVDHLALITNGKPRCPPTAGCSIGRANAKHDLPGAAFGEPIADGGSDEVNPFRIPTSEGTRTAQDQGRIASALETIGAAFGVGVEARTNAKQRVKWESESGKTQYGVIVDELEGDDQPDEKVLVAMYEYLGDSGESSSSEKSDWENMTDESGDDQNARVDRSKLEYIDQFPSSPNRQNAASFEEGDVVDYGNGKLGVITAKLTSDFTWPQGEDDTIDVEASTSEPAYVVARKAGGAKIFWGDELKSGSFDGEEIDPTEIEDPEIRSNMVPEWYPDLEEINDREAVQEAFRENANIPGVDDPGVGFSSGDWPKNWDRTSLLKFWSTVGGSWTSCHARMTPHFGDRNAKKFCAVCKDELMGSERWRGRF